ncbi:MAG: sensor histidine kinase [Treponema sp.]|nr:sensor histidine kinase [Candidatus Treponema equifaecale]
MKKSFLLILISLFFTVFLTAGCKLVDNSDDDIIEIWGKTNSELVKHFLPNIELKKGLYPTQNQLYIAHIAFTNFKAFLERQKDLKDRDSSYISISNKEIVTRLITYCDENIRSIEDIVNKGKQIPVEEKKELYSTIQRNVYFILDDMLELDHNCSKEFKSSIFIYINSLLMLIMIVVVLSVVLVFILASDAKEKTIQVEQSKDYVTHVLMAQEEERSRLSRELHDTIAQDLRSLFSHTAEFSDSRTASEVKEKQQECLNQIRAICYKLSPPDLEENDIKTALEEMVQGFQKKTKIETRLTVVDDVDFSGFDQDDLLNIYRVVQESLTNIEKHSKASEATILFRLAPLSNSLDEKKTQLVIIISDDGKGMHEHLLSKINSQKKETVVKGHFGIKNIKERVFLLNGQIKYSSFQDCGTEIKIQVPLK